MSYFADAHFDLGAIVHNRRKRGEKNVLESFYDSFSKGGFRLIVAAIFIEDDMTDLALREGLLQIQALKDDILESEHFKLVTWAEDLDSDKIGILMSLEGAEPIHRELHLLSIFYDLGVRGLGLVWGRRNYVADGSYAKDPEEGIKGGLTPFGIEVLRKAEALGYFIDVSHLSDTGFSDLLKYSTKPFMASHSNTRKHNDILRNLSDEQMIEIGRRGGVIGINTIKFIVSLDETEQTLEKVCDHIEWMIKIVGEDVPCIGFDICGPYYDDGVAIDVLEGHHEVGKLADILKNRGYSNQTIDKIFGENLIRYYRKFLK